MPDHVVTFPEKLLKTITTRCAIFSLKSPKTILRPEARWGSLSAPPDARPPSHNMGPTSNGRGRGKRGRESRGEEIEEGRGGEKKGEERRRGR